jgi:ribosomal-protein-alanine N-acetyltransferase
MAPHRNNTEPLMGDDGKPIDLTAFELDTERVSLRLISLEHAQDIFREFTSRIARYMSPKPHERIEGTHDFIGSALTALNLGQGLPLVILERNTGEFLGCCGLNGKDDPQHPELSIWVRRSAHGNGYGKEAIVALKRWADINLSCEYLTYPVDRRNKASRRIPEALGGSICTEYRSPAQDGRMLDFVVYKILADG